MTPVRLPQILTGAAIVVAMAGCGDGSSSLEVAAPADLVVEASKLPAGYAPAQFSVTDLVIENESLIAALSGAEVTPEQCRPSADARFNDELTPANSALLAAQGPRGSLVALVSTARRDIVADIAASTGRCASSTTVVTEGNMAGTRVETEFTEMPRPDGVDDALLIRSLTTTTLLDGAASRQLGYAGYALVDRHDHEKVTVQVTVAGATSPAADPAGEAVSPMSAEQFSELFDAAIAAASAD